jgi:succinyl-CoA synthetase beta subunit
MIKLLEHEGKAILRLARIAVPAGGLYRALPPDLSGPLVVKAQVLAGGRGKAGGIRFADDRAAALAIATEIACTPLNGQQVEDVYIEQRLDIAHEFYVAALVDRDIGVPTLLVCAEGGVDIEDVAPDRILRQQVDPLIGLQPFMVNRLVRALALDGSTATAFGHVLERLYDALVAQDAELIEINPLILTKDGALVAADAKVLLDEDAAFRHPGRRAVPDGTAFELASRELGVIGVETGPKHGIAAIMNGAGLTMATLDEVVALGGIMSGVVELHGATAHGPDRIADVIGLVHQALEPAVILVNVHFQFRNLATIAEGIVAALQRVPGLTAGHLVLRLRGEKQDEARRILAEHHCDMLGDFGEACALAVRRAGHT